MKIIRDNNGERVLVIIPREEPREDANVNLYLREEHTNLIFDMDIEWDYNANIMNLYFDDMGFLKLYNKYEIIVKSDENIIYRGKLLIISEEDDIQNFRRSIIKNNKIII